MGLTLARDWLEAGMGNFAVTRKTLPCLARGVRGQRPCAVNSRGAFARQQKKNVVAVVVIGVEFKFSSFADPPSTLSKLLAAA